MFATIVNLSVAGALLTLADSYADISVGETLKLFFDNGGQPIVIKATVLRSEGKQIAFEFSNLSPEAETGIHTKVIRMAIISERIKAMDANELPSESEILESDAVSLVDVGSLVNEDWS